MAWRPLGLSARRLWQAARTPAPDGVELTPIRFYFGNADTEVPPEKTRDAAGALQQEWVNLGQLEHDPALAAATPCIIAGSPNSRAPQHRGLCP